jgi:hypothetical protein
VRINLHKGCGAEVVRNYRPSIPAMPMRVERTSLSSADTPAPRRYLSARKSPRHGWQRGSAAHRWPTAGSARPTPTPTPTTASNDKPTAAQSLDAGKARQSTSLATAEDAAEARLRMALDQQTEQQRLLSEKVRLLNERIEALQNGAAPAPASVTLPVAAPPPPSPATAPAIATAPATPIATGTSGTPSTPTAAKPPAPRFTPPPVEEDEGWWLAGLSALGVLVLGGGLAWLLRQRSNRQPPTAAIASSPSEPPAEMQDSAISRWQLSDPAGLSGFSQQSPLTEHSISGPDSAGADSTPSTATPISATEASNAAIGGQEEATAVLELAEIMVSFGRLAGAAQAIEEFIDNHPRTAVAPWLKLLEIYRQNDQHAAFDTLGQKLKQHFNVAPPTWESMEVNPPSAFAISDVQNAPIEQLLTRLPSISRLPHILAEISHTWDTPECASYLDKLLRDNRNGERQGFTLGTVRELLLIADLLESRLNNPS